MLAASRSRARGLGGGEERRLQLLDVAFGERLVEAVLVAEVAVQDRLRDPGLRGDLLHRGVAPAGADDPVGCVEQLLAPQLALPVSIRLERSRRHVSNLTLRGPGSNCGSGLGFGRLSDRTSGAVARRRRLATPPGSTNMIRIRITPKTTVGDCSESSKGSSGGSCA